ncbi:MAG: arylsulfatase [Prosthecobacter sp.]|nr:arylsulfatase [Prosthecobacter sp.]
MRRLFLLPVLFAAAFCPALGAERPNIILILADDMGFSDLGCYGGEIKTPNLDRLAAEGLRFSQFYNCALCGPSRAALMTGLHPHQVGITGWTGLLNNRCVTAFEVLKRAGYATCAVGRLDMVTAEDWHEPGNIGRYVDRYFGTTGHKGPGNYFKNVRNTAFYRDGKPFSIPDGGYKTDLITDYVEEFIRGADKAKPFVLYMAHYAPHWPLHAKAEDIAKYRELYRHLGWDGAREQRLKRMIDHGLINAGTKLSPRDQRAAPWAEAKFLDWEAERMATYAAQIDCLDQSVGRVMNALRESGADKNTLVFFLSDNGASDQAVGRLDQPNQTWRSDGTRTQVGNKPTIQPGPADNFVTAGPAWANVANAPFREHKQSNHEGGIASPLIAWWPGVIAKAGGITSELAHITDITATCLDAAAEPYPSEFNDRHVTPIAGKSLLPILKSATREAHRSLCWATSGAKAVRIGSWKLVALRGKPWELYDLSTDRTEMNDLAKQQPERVAEMAKVFEDWHAQ